MPQEKRLFSSDSEEEEDYKVRFAYADFGCKPTVFLQPAKKQAGTSKKVESSEDDSDMSDDVSSSEEEKVR